MATKENLSKQFQDYIRIAYEGRWYILTVWVIVAAATWLYTMQQDDVYSAKSSIRLKRPTDILTSQPSLVNQDLGFGAERMIANEIKVITSTEIAGSVARTLLEEFGGKGKAYRDTLPILAARARPSTIRKILRVLKLENLAVSLSLVRIDTSSRLATEEVVASRIRSMTQAQPVRGVDFVEVTVESPSPQEAAIVANGIARAYIEKNLESARQAVSTARVYLEGQRNEKKDSLRNIEQEVKDFQQKQGIVSLSAESQELISQLSGMEAQREQIRIELKAAEKTMAEWESQLATLEPNVGRSLSQSEDPILKKLLSEKAQLEVEMSDIDYTRKLQMKDRPDLGAYFDTDLRKKQKRYEDVQKEINAVTDRMLKSNEITATPLDQARDLKQKIVAKKIELESMRAKLAAVEQTLGGYQRKFDALPEQSIAFARLERARQSNEKLFGLLDQKFQETLINEKTTMGNAEVFDRAKVPNRPTRPNRPMNLLLGVFVGLALGFATAVLLKYLDTTLRSPEDVEKLGMSVLTFIPSFAARDDLKRSETLIAYTAPQAPASEAYRTLRTSLENIVPREEGKAACIIVTSPAPKEGKSTVVSNLAVSSAVSGKRVLLIDSDLRRPVQHSILEIDREPGFSDCLVGGVSINACIRKTLINGLHVMPSGHIPSHPAELLGSDRTPKLLDILRKHYDILFIDSPPIIAMADTLILARHTDGVALVISANSTKTLGLEKSNQILSANNGRILGVIVNRFNATKIYYSYYRYYYQNYYYYSEDGVRKKREMTRS